MIAHIGKRFAAIVPVLFGISILAFLSMALCPGDAAKVSLMALTGSESPPAGAVVEVRRQLGLDRPLAVQYALWLGRVAAGDLGLSYQTGQSVAAELRKAFAASALLAITAMLLTVIISVPAGVFAAVYNRRAWDRVSLVICLFVTSIPNFFLAIVLILVFSIHWKILPVAGYGALPNLILPAATLALSIAAVSTRLMRSSMLDVLGQKFLTAARAKGLSETLVIGLHALRSASIPVISFIGTQFGYLFGGAAVVESIFLWPGLGRLLIDAVRSRDVFMVQGCVLAIAGAYVAINLMVDILHFLIDPRLPHA